MASQACRLSVSIDRTDKFAAYHRNGVREYIVWRVFDREIDWFVARDGRFERLSPDSDGLYRSEVLPGLWLDWSALIAGNLLTVSRSALQGIATPEHAAFVARLQQAAQPGAGT